MKLRYQATTPATPLKILRSMDFMLIFFFVLLSQWRSAHGLDNGLALTPPMGWCAWERFACEVDCVKDPGNCISESLFMDMTDHMAADGFKDVGYEYINIDDCWASKERDENGRLQANPKRFPHGIKYLADYVHSRGLKLGIYGDIGNETCAGYPGSLGHIQTDADTFAEWGVDMLKLDGCFASEEIYNMGYPNMTKALNNSGRPILFSCSWPAYIAKPDYSVIAKHCNMWRNYDDVQDTWDSVLEIIDFYGSHQDDFQPYAGPGHWNDPDMLIIGDYGLSLDQQRAQMAMWAIFASPLLMSNDLRVLSAESKAILLNKEVIAVNQDPFGVQGRLIRSHIDCGSKGDGRVYSRQLKGGSVAVAVLNTCSFGYPYNITFGFAEVGIDLNFTVNVHDVFAMRDIGEFFVNFTASVNPTGARLFKLN